MIRRSRTLQPRRSFLAAAVGALTGSLLRGQEPGGDGSDQVREDSGDGPWSLERFVAVAAPEARRRKEEIPVAGEDAYLHGLAALATRLGEVAEPETMRSSSQGEGVRIGANWAGDPFVVLHWTMEPGARIRPHAHTYGNVVTLGLTGSAWIDNWEPMEAPDFDDEDAFRVRRTHRQLLRPGGINLVPLEHDFVHGFTAGAEGASGLDVTTRLRPREATPYLILEDGSVDARTGVHRGRWRRE